MYDAPHYRGSEKAGPNARQQLDRSKSGNPVPWVLFQRADMMDTKVGADKKDVHNKMQAAWK
jgi:hypothetical protein